MTHIYNPSTKEAEIKRTAQSLRPAWATQCGGLKEAPKGSSTIRMYNFVGVGMVLLEEGSVPAVLCILTI